MVIGYFKHALIKQVSFFKQTNVSAVIYGLVATKIDCLKVALLAQFSTYVIVEYPLFLSESNLKYWVMNFSEGTTLGTKCNSAVSTTT